MELSPEIIKKIKNLEIKTRRLLGGSLAGDYKSAQKGYGLEFEQLADYQLGDDIRFIDWKSSARMNKILVKEYRQERTRTIIVALDCSGSSLLGAKNSKYEMMQQIAGVLTLIGSYNRDLVSLILFSDSVDYYIPPKRGINHIHHILNYIFSKPVTSKSTSIKACIDFIAQMKKKDSICFIISDFIDSGYERALHYLSKKSEVIAIHCSDTFEERFPSIGYLALKDLETGKVMIVDTYKRKNVVNSMLKDRLSQQEALFAKLGITYKTIDTSTSFIDDLVLFLQSRIRY